MPPGRTLLHPARAVLLHILSSILDQIDDLDEAVRESWRVVFEHDPGIASGVLAGDGKNLELREVLEAPRALEASGGPASSR